MCTDFLYRVRLLPGWKSTHWQNIKMRVYCVNLGLMFLLGTSRLPKHQRGWMLEVRTLRLWVNLFIRCYKNLHNFKTWRPTILCQWCQLLYLLQICLLRKITLNAGEICSCEAPVNFCVSDPRMDPKRVVDSEVKDRIRKGGHRDWRWYHLCCPSRLTSWQSLTRWWIPEHFSSCVRSMVFR